MTAIKKSSLLAIVLLLIVASFAGCVSSKTTQPEKIDVVGMPLKEACTALGKVGWVTQTVDDTPYSDYIPGAYENGDTKYASKPVTKVEFQPAQSAGRGYATTPSCKVHFESGNQERLESDYDFDYAVFGHWYDEFATALEEQGPTEEVISGITEAYQELLEYDPGKIPASRAAKHQQLVSQYEALLGIEGTSAASPASSSDDGGIPSGAIGWQEAHSHIGETVSVYGEVKASDYRSGSNGQPTYIDIGAAYPDTSRITVVIWGENRGAFPDRPESMYLGKIVCVTGEIYEYNGVCDIKVTSPNQIAILQ